VVLWSSSLVAQILQHSQIYQCDISEGDQVGNRCTQLALKRESKDRSGNTPVIPSLTLQTCILSFPRGKLLLLNQQQEMTDETRGISQKHSAELPCFPRSWEAGWWTRYQQSHAPRNQGWGPSLPCTVFRWTWPTLATIYLLWLGFLADQPPTWPF
jgi:hypothetical protein